MNVWLLDEIRTLVAPPGCGAFVEKLDTSQQLDKPGKKAANNGYRVMGFPESSQQGILNRTVDG